MSGTVWSALIYSYKKARDALRWYTASGFCPHQEWTACKDPSKRVRALNRKMALWSSPWLMWLRNVINHTSAVVTYKTKPEATEEPNRGLYNHFSQIQGLNEVINIQLHTALEKRAHLTFSAIKQMDFSKPKSSKDLFQVKSFMLWVKRKLPWV